MPGRFPKHPEEAVRRKPPTTKLPEKHGKKVPRPPKDAPAWGDTGKLYWRTIWESPMALVFIAADVPALVRLTTLVELFAVTLDHKLLQEIRQLEDRFGLSPMARRRLQFDIERAGGTVEEIQQEDKRDEERWLRVVGDDS